MYTRDTLEAVKAQDGHPGLKQIGDLFGVKSTGSDSLMTKILEAQNGAPQPSSADAHVDLANMEGLVERKRNMEVPWDEPGSFLIPAQ